MAAVAAVQSAWEVKPEKSFDAPQETIFHIMHVVFHIPQLIFITIKICGATIDQIAEEQHGQQR
jgi:hypothetical protein